MTENERLDQIVKWISELSGQVSALQHQMGALRVDIEAMRFPHHPAENNQYWIIVAGFVIAASIIASALFYIGAPR